MTELSRRELARLAAGMLTGAAFGPAAALAAGTPEIDAPGGLRLLRRLIGDDPDAAVAAARRLKGGARAAGRAVLALPRGARLVAELAAGGYRFSAWARRLGSVTIVGDRGVVRRVVTHPRRRTSRVDPYDTVVAVTGGVVLTSSAALAQRERPARWIAGARLPADYSRLGRGLFERLANERARPRSPRRR